MKKLYLIIICLSLFKLSAFQAYIPQMVWKECYMIYTNVYDISIYMDTEKNIIHIVKN